MKLYITYGFGYDQRNNYSVVEGVDEYEIYEQIDAVTGGKYAFAYDEEGFEGQVESYGLTEIPLQAQTRSE
jgi:hypothetical protein